MIIRLYTGDDGQSHFEELDMDVGPYPWRELSPNPPIHTGGRREDSGRV